MRKLYSVYNKSNRGTLIIAFDEDSAKEIMFKTGRVRDINNITKIIDVTISYKNFHPSFDPDLLNPGLFYAKINGMLPEEFITVI